MVGYRPRDPVRSSLDDRSGLIADPDGAIEIRLQPGAPDGHERNRLQTPGGAFRLTLRAYLPGAAILDDTYRVPPVVRVRG